MEYLTGVIVLKNDQEIPIVAKRTDEVDEKGCTIYDVVVERPGNPKDQSTWFKLLKVDVIPAKSTLRITLKENSDG